MSDEKLKDDEINFPCYTCPNIGNEAPRCSNFMNCPVWCNWSRQQKILKAMYIPDDDFVKLIQSDGEELIHTRGIKPESENPSKKLYMCMPLKLNVPIGHNDWLPVNCPECNRPCWQRPIPAELEKLNKEIIQVCTHCAIRHGVTGK